jgi:hypothetical protein
MMLKFSFLLFTCTVDFTTSLPWMYGDRSYLQASQQGKWFPIKKQLNIVTRQ